MAHRYSYEIHNGKISKGLIVLHKCDTPKCVNPKHLLTGTHKDNSLDREKKGRSQTGENHYCSKLNKDSLKARLNLRNKRLGKNNPFYGKKHTKDSLRKIGQASLGHKVSEETRKKISETKKKNNNEK